LDAISTVVTPCFFSYSFVSILSLLSLLLMSRCAISPVLRITMASTIALNGVTSVHPALPVLDAEFIFVQCLNNSHSRVEPFAPMPDHLQRCRGCKCDADEAEFRHQGKQYKQCSRCRARIHHRRHSSKTVVCQCGRQVLGTSLRDHLRTLYHEQQIALLVGDKQQQPKTQPVNKSPEQAPRKAAIDHPKPVVAHQAQRAATVHVKPAVAGQAKAAATVLVKQPAAGQAKLAAGEAKPAAADLAMSFAKPVATGRAELVVKPMITARVKPAAIPPDAVPASGMQTIAKDPPAQIPRSPALKAPAAPVSMTPASLLFAKLKQMQARP
jgi:hypothetical protein